jgi:hypothetical protein
VTVPTFVQASTGSTDSAGAWTATGAAGTTGNLVIFHLFIDGATSAPGFTTFTNVENLAGTDNAMTSIAAQWCGGTDVAQHQLLFGRLLNTSAPTITGTNAAGDDLYWRWYEFTGVATGTTIGTVIENIITGNVSNQYKVERGTSASVADAGVQTNDVDRLACNFVGADDDVTIGPFTGMTGGTWAETVAEFSSATGTDAMIQLQTADMAAAGTIDGGTVAPSLSCSWGVIGFALIGTTVAGGAVSDPTSWISERRTPRRRSMQRW